jgi:hypothetical protein
MIRQNAIPHAFSCMLLTTLTFSPVLNALGQEEAAPAVEDEYNPEPFLNSMVLLRSTAMTCDPFVANSPAARTDSIVEFFAQLDQQLPDLAHAETQSSLNRFIGSQAAAICRDRLDASFDGFAVELASYVQHKPEAWPAPPSIARASWCSSENCLEF